MDGTKIVFLVLACSTFVVFCQEDREIGTCSNAITKMKDIRAQITDALADTITAAENLTDKSCNSTETASDSLNEILEKLEEIRNATADKLISLHQSALNRVWPGLNASNPAASCTEILDVIPFAPSVNYWLRSSNGSTIHVFCNMTLFPCQPGFSEEERTCEDVDECTIGSHNCDAHAVCINTVGNFICTCQFGYVGDGVTCNDIDECISTDICRANEVCTNTQGSFTCTCQPGYVNNGKKCTDINECVIGSHNCDARAVCTNTIGSFTCACQSGYAGGGVICNDIDECANGTDNCDMNAMCNNTHGSFTCTCQPGYAGNGVTCTDVHECSVGSHNCDINAICTNTIGSFTCQCRSGYTGDGVTCNDVNECAVGTDNCDANAVCTNTIGSFTCGCQSGYAGSGVTCSDINECTTGIDNCHVDAVCINTHGSFTCRCRTGYSGNGVTCNDVNECATGTHNCDPNGNAICTNNIGGFSCSCRSGYAGNGLTCALLWPRGRYSLPQAAQGCPTGWSSGWRFQDNEDDRNNNHWSPSDMTSYMRMGLGEDYSTFYCTKVTESRFGPNSGTLAWPRGTYCIARYGGSCPSGFSTGMKVWDDEDDRNANSKQDPLPDGVYDTNTRIHYCCRSDSPTWLGMRLPTSQPFVLYRHGGNCQTVRGMTVRQLFVHFDDEDSSNDNSCSGSNPDDSDCDRDQGMYFCYYS